jgi:hypothetical protein
LAIETTLPADEAGAELAAEPPLLPLLLLHAAATSAAIEIAAVASSGLRA